MVINLEKPNILLLVMDAARASNFSTYGYGRKTDPNISKLAEEGLVFEKCYSNSIWTLPSHHSIFTGLLPSHHGITSKEGKKSTKKMLTEKLTEEGYRTIGVSSNGFISPLYGFDEVFDEFYFLGDSFNIEDKMLFPGDDLFKEVYEKEKEDEWMDKKEKYAYLLKESVTRFSPQSIANGLYYLLNEKNVAGRETDDGAEKANEKMLNAADSSEPFFGFINYVETHDPYDPPKEYVEDFLEDYSYEEAMEISDNADLVEYLKESPEEAEVLEDLYDGEIKYLDFRIGELVENTREKSDRETIVVIASDHGENFDEGENLWGHYGKMTRELVHVPLIINGLKEGEVTENFSLRDLHDLILGLTEKDLDIEASEKVITEYWGLESHYWDLETEELRPELLQNQKSVVSDKFSLWGEDFQENLSEEERDYISIRCGDP